MSTVLPEIFTGEQLANFDAFYSAISTGVWGEETPSALAEIGAALATSGVTTDTYFSLVDQYTKAIAARDGATQHQLLKRIADGISRMAYENARRWLSFKVRRFAEHPDFSFLAAHHDHAGTQELSVARTTASGTRNFPQTAQAMASGMVPGQPSGCTSCANTDTKRVIPVSLPIPLFTTPLVLGRIEVRPLTGRLKVPFPIASDRTKTSDIDGVLVTLQGEDGLVGLGEGSPFTGISGDNQTLLLEDVTRVIPILSGQTLTLERLEILLQTHMRYPAARAAVEMAFFDLLAKQQNVPLVHLLNPPAKTPAVETDITIPIVDPEMAKQQTEQYLRAGFRRLKIKVGDGVDAGVERVKAVFDVYRTLGKGNIPRLLIDANAGYTADEAIALIQRLAAMNIVPVIFEQPVKRDDIQGLRRVREVANPLGMSVFADESVYSLRDAQTVLDAKAVDGINLKLMKHGGLLEAMRIADFAREHGLKLMIGGMVETRLGMSVSLHLALAMGDVVWFDLDTPMLIEGDPLSGGIQYAGPSMTLPQSPGIGVQTQ